jgi:hypothetical protein
VCCFDCQCMYDMVTKRLDCCLIVRVNGVIPAGDSRWIEFTILWTNIGRWRLPLL